MVNPRRSNRLKKLDESSESDSDFNPKKRNISELNEPDENEESEDIENEYDSDEEEDDIDDEEEDEEEEDDIDDDPMNNGRFIVPDTYVEHADGRIEYDPTGGKDKSNRRYKWIRDADDKTYKKFESKYDRMVDSYNEKDINELDILKSDLPRHKVDECYEKLRVLRNEKRILGETENYMKSRNSLYEIIKKSNPFTEEDENETSRLKNLAKGEEDLELRIIRSKHPDLIKIKMMNVYNEIKYSDNEESIKKKNWIETCLSLPTEVVELNTKYKDCVSMLLQLRKQLDDGLYGQEKVKERIIEVMTAMWTNPHRSRNCMVFLGNPGVGKTEMARLLAKSIDFPFYQISFGGAQDSSILKGHSFTYVGSRPGEIVEALISMGIKNGVLFLDELDKIKDSVKGHEVINSLLHILDYTQNTEFKDNYLHGIPIDISKLIIVVSINDLDIINSVLRDRLPVVTFNNYNIDDKINIGTDYLVPRILKNINMNPSLIKYDKSSVAYIIEQSKIEEAGVRQLERNIGTIFERINVLMQIHSKKSKDSKRIKVSYDIPNFKTPFVLTKSAIDTLFEEYRTDLKI